MRHSIWPARFAALALLMLTLVLETGCSDARFAAYRDPREISEYHYALGEQYVEVGGLRICYQEFGQGPTVVIIPGLATNVDFWQQNIPVLAERFHVIALDPPGFGKSDKPADVPYDVPWLTERIRAFLDRKGVERFSAIGGSLGGHLALKLAMDHPERVDKLVMMGSTGGWPEPDPFMRLVLAFWDARVVAEYTRYHWPSFYARMFKYPNAASDRIFRYQMAMRADRERYAPEGRAIGRALRSIFFHSYRERLDELQAPLLLVWGAEDRIHPPNSGVELRERTPDSRLVIVADSAHEVMSDQPEVFNRVVLDFLSGGTAAVADDPPVVARQPPWPEALGEFLLGSLN